MKRIHLHALLCMSALAAGTVLPADVSPTAGPRVGPGWTGVTNPRDVITARQELMEHMEILMQPIDTITVEEVRNVDQLHSNAEAISGMLLAVPHLFPPTTNLYDPRVLEPVTLALPAIWKDFGSFYRIAASAFKAAEEMEAAEGTVALRAASLRLRASCDACHELYLRHYEPPKVQESDYKFDFESALPGKK